MPDQGAFAESREWLGERRLAEDPAVWTMYQAMDSEVPDPVEAWQIAADRLRALRKVPIVGDGVPADAGWQIACSDWQPYVWSLTLLVLAENLATALALFQAGLAGEGYGLLRGSLLDAGYRGLCPGNFPMSLQLDPHRQESQRDFGDPIGCASRALVEGLWGVRPDLLAGRLTLRPQLPLQWEKAQFSHPEVEIEYGRKADVESWLVVVSFGRTVQLSLELRARTMELPTVRVNGRAVAARFLDNAVGEPRLVLDALSDGPRWKIELRWRGAPPVRQPHEPIRCMIGNPIPWPANVQVDELRDPQRCLKSGVPARAGGHTVFALQKQGHCRFWLPLELRVASAEAVGSAKAIFSRTGERFEPVPLGTLLTGQVREILTRGYRQPRSGLCSLGLPEGLLGGWANFDVTAPISDAGLRRAGGLLRLPSGVSFLTAEQSSAPNCCYLSQWAQDSPRARIALHGRARSLHLLIAGTTFPQATGSPHASVRVIYNDAGQPTQTELRSPSTWWPVEQDYLVDDYVFRLDSPDDPQQPLPWRIDLLTGKARELVREELRGKGGPIRGGAAFVARIDLEPERELAAVELKCELYGIVLGLLGVTLGR